ncbi:MAG: hypothetical protein HYZ28_23905 [Myxococcales bacterium]|nr:hypothetical protein [Myxococcales bacterium]
MRDRFPLLVIGGLVLLGVLGSYLFRGAARGSFADTLSTYRSEKDGARALYLLGDESGVPVQRLQRNLDLIAEGTNLVLLAVGFSDRVEEDIELELPLVLSSDAGVDEEELADHHRGWNRFRASLASKEEREKLLEHVKKGATLVYLPWGSRPCPLLGALEVKLSAADRAVGMRTLVPAQPSPYTLGVERTETAVQSFLALPDDGVPLLLDDTLGGVVAALVPYGQGRVVVIGAPELAMNEALPRADNAQLWLSLMRAASATGPLAFDEFHHGFTSDRSVAEFAARYGLHFAAAQLLLGLSLWAASLRRFGRPRTPPQDIRLGGTDALFAASRIYREGRHYSYAASLLARGASQDLAPGAGIPPRTEPAEVAAALSARGRADLARALTEVIHLSHATTSEAQLRELARKAASARLLIKPGRRRAEKKALAPAARPSQSRPSVERSNRRTS